MTVDSVEDLRCLLRVLGQTARDVFENRGGDVIFPEDRVADHGAAGAVARRFRSAGEDGAAQIGQGQNERRVGCAVRAGLGAAAGSGGREAQQHGGH